MKEGRDKGKRQTDRYIDRQTSKISEKDRHETIIRKVILSNNRGKATIYCQWQNNQINVLI